MSTRVLFELHGVLLLEDTEVTLEHLGAFMPPEVARCVNHEFREVQEELASGAISDERWWKHVSAKAGLSRTETDALLSSLHSGFHSSPEVVNFANHLIERGFLVGAVGNISPSSAVALRTEQPWLDDFAAVIFSCDIGVSFPRPEAFTVACDALSALPKDVVFFGATPELVAAAQRGGIHAYQFTSVAKAQDVIAQSGGGWT